jgi:hypothetical protein
MNLLLILMMFSCWESTTVFCWIYVEMIKTYGKRLDKIVFSRAAGGELFVQDYEIR